MEFPKYNPDTKIWEGAVVPYPFDENAGVAEIAFNHMKDNLNWICQISDDSNEIYTYERVLKEAISLANALKYKYGVRQGDRIVLYMDFHHYMLPTWFGCVLAGALICPFTLSGETQDEIADLIEMVNPVMLISSENKDLTVMHAVLKQIRLNIPILTYNNSILTNDDLKQLLENNVELNEFQVPKISDPNKDTFMLFMSSGTTSKSKLINISHKQILMYMIDSVSNVKISAAMRPGWGSVSIIVFYCLVRNITLVIRAHYTIDEFLLMISKHKANVLYIKPVDIYEALKSKILDNVSLDSVRICMSLGQHLSPNLAEKFEKYLKNSFVISLYGVGDFGGAITTPAYGKGPSGSVGKIARNVKVKIVDENEKLLDPNEIGEIRVKSIYANFLGYFHNEKLTKEAVDDEGYFKTGDIGYVDDDANLFLVDRKKFLISYRGEWINQSKIEMAVLENVPGCLSVSCVDIEDEINGVMPIVAIVPEEGVTSLDEEKILKVVRESHNFPFETKIMFFETLPLTISDKTKKYVLRDMIIKKLHSN